MMQLDQRSLLIAETLIEEPAIKGRELEELIGISRKQLSYSLGKINDYFSYRKVPEIKRLRNGYFHIPFEAINIIKEIKGSELESSYIFSEKERLYAILMLLLNKNEELSIYHFTSELGVSRNTLITDLKKLETIIEPYEITIFYSRKEGYCLSGSEFSKRALFSFIIHKLLALPKGEEIINGLCSIDDKKLKELKTDIELIEKNLEVEFTDQWLSELKYMLYFIIHRTEGGNLLNELPEIFHHVIGTKEHSSILSFGQKYNITNPLERIYIAATIQASNIHHIKVLDLDVEDRLIVAMRNVVNNFENISCVIIKDKVALIDALIQHCKPAFYRMKYNYHIENSIIDMILPQHNYLHELVKKSIDPFEAIIGISIPDEELVYITALIGAWLKREGKLEILEYKKKAIVVCTYGISVSNYILVTLEELFPEIEFIGCLSIRDFLTYKNDYNIVFSTVPLETDKIQFIIKNFSGEEAKQAFREKVFRDLEGLSYETIEMEKLVAIIEKHATIDSKTQLSKDIMTYLSNLNKGREAYRKDRRQTTRMAPELSDLLNDDTVIVAKETMTWEDAINKAAQPLLLSQKIEKRYIDNVIKIINEEKPYILIGDGVIIPHAGILDGALEVGMSLLKLPEKISINNYLEADIVIFLATPDTSIHLKALHRLNDILEDKNLLKEIKSAKDGKEILGLLDSTYERNLLRKE